MQCFSVSHCRVDLTGALCISITAPVISARIWAYIVSNAWAVRILELESSVTSFAELVAPLVSSTKPSAALVYSPASG